MKKINHKISERNVTLELLIFEKEDKKLFTKTFDQWVKLNSIIKKELLGTRKTNFPESLSEPIFCLEMNFGKLIKAIGNKKYSTSFDCFDIKRDKRIQLKCSSSNGPTQFGPRSQYDEIYFIDFNVKGFVDGYYEIYKINNSDIDNVLVNKTQKLTDQQEEKRRARVNIRSKIIKPKNLQPIKTGNLKD